MEINERCLHWVIRFFKKFSNFFKATRLRKIPLPSILGKGIEKKNYNRNLITFDFAKKYKKILEDFMKKIILSLLAVLMVFAFVACDNPSGPSNVEKNDSEKVPVEETWTALTSLEGVEGAFRWDDLDGMDEKTQVLRFGNNEMVLEIYKNGELDEEFEVSAKDFLKWAAENEYEINSTKTKLRIDDVEYIKFSGIVEKPWTTVTSLEGLNGTWIFEQDGSDEIELIIDNVNVTMTSYYGDDVYPKVFTENEFFDFVKAEYDSDVYIYRTGEKLAFADMVFNKQKRATKQIFYRLSCSL
jgi:hypothetical protein